MSNVITLANSMGDVLGKFPRNFMQFGPPCEQAEYFDFCVSKNRSVEISSISTLA